MEQVKLFPLFSYNKETVSRMEAEINAWLSDQGDSIEIVNRSITPRVPHGPHDDLDGTVLIAIYYRKK